MSPRIQQSRHAVPTSGPYPVPRPQPLLTCDASYPASCMGGVLDDAATRHYSLSSNGTYTRNRHDQGSSWNNANKSFFPDQESYTALPQATHGSFTMNPVDAVYSQAMLTGYEAIAPLDSASNVFNPLDVAPMGRQQVFNEQDMIQDSIIPLEMNDFGTYLPHSGIPYSRHTTWINGQPSPTGSECMLANPTMTSSNLNRHGVAVADDLHMRRDISPYELVEHDPFSRHSDMRYAPVQPRPLRSASERKDSSSEEAYQGDATRSSDQGHEKKKPRSDGAYNTGPNPDGWYRCPFSSIQDCNHKPTKQKCIYDKNLDSHLKPYKCTEKNCEDSSFSSNACLFRHQREAHGLHGHSAHLCHWPNCERAQPGNGFPRKWNLGDHMKRVHAYDMTKDSGEDSSRKRRHASSAVPMKRSTSSKDKVFPASSMQYARSDRHTTTATRHNQRQAYPSFSGYDACNTAFPYQEYDNMIYAQHSRQPQPLVGY